MALLRRLRDGAPRLAGKHPVGDAEVKHPSSMTASVARSCT
jgi:hypothetical protein